MKQVFLTLTFALLLLCIPCSAKPGFEDIKADQISNPIPEENLKSLIATCQLWGFLKYHHPYVATGNLDWDKELINRIPAIMEAKSESEWKKMLDEWISSLPAVNENKTKILPGKRTSSKPNYGELFNPEYFDAATISKIKFILDNAVVTTSKYMKVDANSGQMTISNEPDYFDMLFPALPYRLLALFRYWNIINYFFPYRDLCDQKWSEVLPEMLPAFISCENTDEYICTCLRLVTKIDDSHAFFNSQNYIFSLRLGMLRMPFEARFFENKLVITTFTGDDAQVKEKLKIGDVITAIDGQLVESIVKSQLPYTAASNHAVKLRNIASRILNGNETFANITIERDNESFDVRVPRYDQRKLNIPDYGVAETDTTGYRIINNNIGYVLPSRCKAKDRETGINLVLNGTKGLIIDMRCYPTDYISFPFLDRLQHETMKFSLVSYADISWPGYFFYYNDNEYQRVQQDPQKLYRKKVVVLVNEFTQSQAEDVTLGFQLAHNVTVIGSTTAGANGKIVSFSFPGGITTMMTGLGVYYPDFTNLQRCGVHIDETISPTISGIKSNRDEVLLRALEIINSDSQANK
jgi:C-terminal processing protease CtpA/Prc